MRHGVKIDYQNQKVSLRGKDGGEMHFWGTNNIKEISSISLMAARKLIRKGHEAYLRYMIEDKKGEKSLRIFS